MPVSYKGPVLGPRAKTLSPAHREGQGFSKHLLEGLQKGEGLTGASCNQEKARENSRKAPAGNRPHKEPEVLMLTVFAVSP